MEEEIKELIKWCENFGNLQKWEEDSKFNCDVEWNDDKSYGYKMALFYVHEKLCKVIGKEGVLDKYPDLGKE